MRDSAAGKIQHNRGERQFCLNNNVTIIITDKRSSTIYVRSCPDRTERVSPDVTRYVPPNFTNPLVYRF